MGHDTDPTPQIAVSCQSSLFAYRKFYYNLDKQVRKLRDVGTYMYRQFLRMGSHTSDHVIGPRVLDSVNHVT